MDREIGLTRKRADVLVRPVSLLLFIIILGATLTPFLTWNVNSLWGDELFSLYFSDPSQSFRGAVFRSLEDVHPPTYYLILYGLRRTVSLDPILVGRTFSAVCAAGSLVVLWLATGRFLSRSARLLMLVGASLSIPYFGQSVEIRSYALDFLLVSLMIAIALQWTAPGANRPRWKIVAFTLFLIGSTTVHYYLVFVAATVLGFLVLNARDRNEALQWIGGGLAVALASGLFLRWHEGFIVPDLALDGPANLSVLNELKLGTIMLARSPILIALALSLPFLVRWRPIATQVLADPLSYKGYPIVLAVLGSVGTLLLALAFTLVIDPVFAARLFTIIAPFVWLGTGVLFEQALDQDERGWVLGTFAVVSIWSAGRIADHFQQLNPDYRSASESIFSEPGCLVEPIGVAGFRQPFIKGNEVEAFYGYYKPAGTELQLVRSGRPHSAIAAQLEDMASRGQGWSARRCPTLLWSGRGFSLEQMKDFGRVLETSEAFPSNCRTEVAEFPTTPLTSVDSLPPPLRRSIPRYGGDMLTLRLMCVRPSLTPNFEAKLSNSEARK